MLDICYEAFEDLKNDIENNDFIETKYLDTWDFEDEYSLIWQMNILKKMICHILCEKYVKTQWYVIKMEKLYEEENN